jgi:proteasome component ECM29
VRCLFECLEPSAAAAGGWYPQSIISRQELLTRTTAIKSYLEEMTPLVDKAVIHGTRKVQVSLYEELGKLFERFGKWATAGNGQKPEAGELQGSLMALAQKMLCREIDISIETIRMGRAQAAAAYVTASQQMGLEVSQALQESVKTWRDGERSGPVQQILNQVLGDLAVLR